ncbi:MAG: hypothetical protein HQL80_12415 [Magnetococcales bacterium]|nr:hypothetical protein [Magnetococcales bacterium]
MPLATNKNCTLTVPPQPGGCPGHTLDLHVSQAVNKRLATTEFHVALATRLTPEMEDEAEKQIEKIKKRRKEISDQNRELEAKKKAASARFVAAAEQYQQVGNRLAEAGRDAEDDASKARDELRQRISAIQADLRIADRWNQETNEAKARLESLTAGSDQKTITDAEIQVLRANVETARQNLAKFQAKKSADKESKRIAKMAKIRDILAPDGLRATKLNAAMNNVVATLIKICALARWPTIAMDSDLSLYMADIPFALLSKSEQFRCQIAMQVLIARFTGAELLLIDGADILDASPSGRIGLVKMLREYGIPTLITMTEKREYAERVARLFDAVYWVADGKTEEIVQIAKQVAA